MRLSDVTYNLIYVYVYKYYETVTMYSKQININAKVTKNILIVCIFLSAFPL